jgi:predicted MFS family arabinose efflux permease
MQTYQMPAGDTALPLAVAGVGVIVGGVVGGWAADQRCRLAWLAASCWGKGFALRRHSRASGLLAALVFTVQVSPWATVALAMGVAGFSRISSAVTPILLLKWAGSSRTTATGLFAVSNQMGVFGGASLGGLMLALGGFPRVGLFCLGVSVIAAVVLQLKVRDSAASPVQMALREGTRATE